MIKKVVHKKYKKKFQKKNNPNKPKEQRDNDKKKKVIRIHYSYFLSLSPFLLVKVEAIDNQLPGASGCLSFDHSKIPIILSS